MILYRKFLYKIFIGLKTKQYIIYIYNIIKLFYLTILKMISNNNKDSHNKLEKLEQKKKIELQLLKINYEVSTREIARKK